MDKKRIFTLMWKEVLAIWQDKKSRVLLIVPPLLQLFLFAWAATLDVTNVSLGVLNNDTGKWSFELIQRFKGSPTFSEIHYFQTADELTWAVDNQTVILAMHIDSNFSRRINAEESARVQLILDGRRSNSAQIVQGYASRIINRFNQDLNRYLGREDAHTALIPYNWFNPNLIYPWFTVTGLVAILTTLIAISLTSLSIARERETGTFEQLLVSPLLPIEILIGKATPPLILGMIEGSFILLAGVTIFGVPFVGSLFLLYVAMFVFVLSIVGVGLFISSLCATQQQAMLGVFVFMAPAVILSGYATPIENMPEWMQVITYFNPLRYFIFIARGIIMKGLPASSVFENLWPMALIAAFTLTTATSYFRKKLL